MTDATLGKLRQAIEAGDDAEVRRLVLDAIAETRLALGLPTRESALSTVQLAATYRADIANLLLRHAQPLDGYSACALGREPTIERDELGVSFEGLTPLGIAIVNGHADTVARLLDAGDDPNRAQTRAAFFAWEDLFDPLDWRPIHLAAAHGYHETSVTIIDALIDAGADINAFCPLGETPLHLASTFGWVAILNRLLDAGVWVDQRSVATFDRIKQYASPNNELPTDATALHIAAREGRADAARQLIDRGAAVDTRDDAGRTPLHEAAAPWWRENVDVIDLLLAANADPSARDHQGQTPLEHALARGFTASGARLG